MFLRRGKNGKMIFFFSNDRKFRVMWNILRCKIVFKNLFGNFIWICFCFDVNVYSKVKCDNGIVLF